MTNTTETFNFDYEFKVGELTTKHKVTYTITQDKEDEDKDPVVLITQIEGVNEASAIFFVQNQNLIEALWNEAEKHLTTLAEGEEEDDDHDHEDEEGEEGEEEEEENVDSPTDK